MNKKGNVKAEYEAEVLKTISKQLADEFGNGFSLRNIEAMRQY